MKGTFMENNPLVATTIITLDLFNEVTRKRKYRDQLKLALFGFRNNHLQQIMYNPENGASYDGLEDKCINQVLNLHYVFFKARLIMEKHLD
jgi:hypothetical protein